MLGQMLLKKAMVPVTQSKSPEGILCEKLICEMSSCFKIYENMAPGPPWMLPFKILELVLHKKYNMKGRNSKVGISKAEF